VNRDFINLLLIEDDPVDATLVHRTLRQEPDPSFSVRLQHATTLQQGLDRLGKGDIDAVLLDLHLPDSEGVETVRRLRENDPDVPIVVLTVSRDASISLRALQAGAQDYLAKDEIPVTSVLSRAIRHAIERRRMQRERRRLVERMARTEKTASLGVLAAGLAVAFNQMLGEILEDVDDCIQSLHEPGSRDRERGRLQSVRRTTLRVGELVARLRDYAADQGCVSHPIELPRVVLDSAEYLDALVGEGVEIGYDLEAETPIVRGGNLQMHQILVSLVSNASESIGTAPGRISISTGGLQADAELLARGQGHPERRPGAYAFLRVSDSGGGIAPAVRPRIFDPFFTTKRAGRGLGLAAVLGILRELGAVIVVESQPGHGASFTVLFPTPEA
jgi:C4-dicarboxylate-specific signal transduction histidine kinase